MSLFTDEEQLQISKAIENAEKHTTGELRVCIEKTCSEDVLQRAVKYFHQLGMQNTRQRHGVLIYLATADRKFAIIGDEGIDKAVHDNFWDATKNLMLEHFKKGDLVQGLTLGVEMAGRELQKNFPQTGSSLNQLPNDVAFMDGE